MVQVFWTEGVSLGVVAWGVALIVGIPAAYGLDQLLGQVLSQAPFAFDPTSLIVMLVFLLVVATVAAGAGLGRVAGEVRPDLALGVTLPTLGERMQTPEVVTSLASAPVMKRLSDGSKTDHRSAGCGAGALAGAGSVVY